MSDTVITVDNLGKAYQIGRRAQQGKTFREAVTDSLRAPFRRMANLAAGGSGETDDTFWALKDVSFQINRGDVVGIIGRNGAGKSTLLKILSRITEPTAGSVRLKGRVASLLEVGTGFHPELTGRENIYLNGAILGMRRAEIARKFDEIVAFAEIEKFLDTQVKRYSSGMYVRLAFAVAAHLEPEILIVDEVLAVGDAEFQKKCLGKMEEVSKGGGRTVLFVSHNMAAIESLCSTGIVLRDGQVLVHGPAHVAVARYLERADSGTAAGERQALRGDDFEFHGVNIHALGGAIPRTFAPCTIELALAMRVACQPAAHLFIEDRGSALVCGLDSRDFFTGKTVPAGTPVKCVFNIQQLPLHAGTYRIRVVLRNDTDYRAWEVPAYFDLVVEPSNVYGTRQIDPQYHGTTAVNAQVEISCA